MNWKLQKISFFYQSLSLTLMEVFNGQPIHQQYHTGIVQLDAYHLFSIARNFKGAAFQSLVVQMITTSVPMKQLGLVSVLINEKVHIATAGVQR